MLVSSRLPSLGSDVSAAHAGPGRREEGLLASHVLDHEVCVHDSSSVRSSNSNQALRSHMGWNRCVLAGTLFSTSCCVHCSEAAAFPAAELLAPSAPMLGCRQQSISSHRITVIYNCHCQHCSSPAASQGCKHENGDGYNVRCKPKAASHVVQPLLPSII